MKNALFNLLVSNPGTSDNIILYSIIGIVALFGLIIIFLIFNKKQKDDENQKNTKE